jgi:hypothetical protein
MALDDQEHRIARVTLLDHHLAGREPPHLAPAQQPVELAEGESAERRRVTHPIHQGEGVHVSHIVSFWYANVSDRFSEGPALTPRPASVGGTAGTRLAWAGSDACDA